MHDFDGDVSYDALGSLEFAQPAAGREADDGSRTRDLRLGN
ncbi:MAG TPA: hypothetical protein VFB89_13230 [Gemmatimonadales bacterium]|nr:hypothetical protein [Gemmatimonadales bacterium]